ncbi:MAG: ABC transporter permease [Chloroflexota bacterium]
MSSEAATAERRSEDPGASELPVTILEPPRGWAALELRAVWEYRELLYFFAWRDLKVRYKQTAIGVAWAVIQPFFTMVVFAVFFGGLAKVPSDGMPYAIFAYTALVPWTYFAGALANAGSSVVSHEHMVTKVYFPRLLLPLSAVLSGLVDLSIAFVVLVALMFYFGMAPTAAMVALPGFVLLAMATAVGAGLWLSAMNVEYRDIRYAIPFLLQIWMFATPIVYPSSVVPEAWRVIYGLNPMAGVVDGFRWALLGAAQPSVPLLAASVATVALLLITGLYYFRRMESGFADIV